MQAAGLYAARYTCGMFEYTTEGSRVTCTHDDWANRVWQRGSAEYELGLLIFGGNFETGRDGHDRD